MSTRNMGSAVCRNVWSKMWFFLRPAGGLIVMFWLCLSQPGECLLSSPTVVGHVPLSSFWTFYCYCSFFIDTLDLGGENDTWPCKNELSWSPGLPRCVQGQKYLRHPSLAGIRISSGVARTWISAHMGCWRHRQWFNRLHRSTSPLKNTLSNMTCVKEHCPALVCVTILAFWVCKGFLVFQVVRTWIWALGFTTSHLCWLWNFLLLFEPNQK